MLSHEYTWIDNPDIVQMTVPRLQFQQATWGIGRFPLWDPHLWCGQPFLGQIVGAAFPLTWPLFLLPSDASNKIALDALNWYFVFLHFLGGIRGIRALPRIENLPSRVRLRRIRLFV